MRILSSPTHILFFMLHGRKTRKKMFILLDDIARIKNRVSIKYIYLILFEILFPMSCKIEWSPASLRPWHQEHSPATSGCGSCGSEVELSTNLRDVLKRTENFTTTRTLSLLNAFRALWNFMKVRWQLYSEETPSIAWVSSPSPPCRTCASWTSPAPASHKSVATLSKGSSF